MQIVRRSRRLTPRLGPHRIQRSNRALQSRGTAVKCGIGIAFALACMAAAAPRLSAQGQDKSGAPGAGQSQPAAGGQSPAQQQPAQTRPQTNANPFPEDTDSVPVMPTRLSPDLPPGAGDESRSGFIPIPAEDGDPMRSPEDAAACRRVERQRIEFEPDGMGDLPSPDDDTTQPGKTQEEG
jgi:hypothetical protein